MKQSLRRGHTLLEMLAVVVILAIVLNVATQVVLTCMRLSAFGTNAADAFAQGQDIEEAFRGATREAFAVVPGAGSYRTGAEAVVLETPGAEEELYVVMGCLGDPRSFSVLTVRESGGTLQPEAMRTFPVRNASITFAYDAPDPSAARLVTMQLTPQGRDARAVSAALRGRMRQ